MKGNIKIIIKYLLIFDQQEYFQIAGKNAEYERLLLRDFKELFILE